VRRSGWNLKPVENEWREINSESLKASNSNALYFACRLAKPKTLLFRENRNGSNSEMSGILQIVDGVIKITIVGGLMIGIYTFSPKLAHVVFGAGFITLSSFVGLVVGAGVGLTWAFNSEPSTRNNATNAAVEYLFRGIVGAAGGGLLGALFGSFTAGILVTIGNALL
jgi:hypothetical protein